MKRYHLQSQTTVLCVYMFVFMYVFIRGNEGSKILTNIIDLKEKSQAKGRQNTEEQMLNYTIHVLIYISLLIGYFRFLLFWFVQYHI